MTTKEMRNRIKKHCDRYIGNGCLKCKLYNKRNCYMYATTEEIKENYNILFVNGENMEMFKKEDIKPGYVLEITTENNIKKLVMVAYNKEEKLCYSSNDMWGSLNNFDDDLKCVSSNRQITKIYGYCSYNSDTYKISTYGRALLWERKQPKEMTMKEIEEALGYPVKIVKE